MTPLIYSVRSGVDVASSRLSRGAMMRGLACIAGASLLVDTDHYPVALEVGSATIRVQDLLFATLILLAAPALAAWARGRVAVAAALGGLVALLFASAADSPVGASAIVAVAKYAEFVLAGMAMGVALAGSRRPTLVTGMFAVGCFAVALGAAADLVMNEALRGLWRSRSGGSLPMESAAAVAGTATAWFAIRLTRLEGMREKRLALLGLAAAAVVFLLAKSALLLGLLLAMALLAPVLRSRWYRRAAVACLLLVVLAAAGRWGDVTAATHGVAPLAPAVAMPPEGRPPMLPLDYVAREWPGTTGGSFVHRTALAYMGVRTAADAPVLGHGWLATSDPAFLRDGPYDRYQAERFPRLAPTMFVSNAPTASHNGYIQTVAEAGVLTGLALVGVLLAAALPAIVTIRRRRTIAPWRPACGLAWLVITAVFLSSSTLYGGQFEAVLLGAAVVVATADRTLAPSRRAWCLGVLAVVVLAAPLGAALVLPAGDAESSPLNRVTAVNPVSGEELMKEGTRLADARDVDLRNGLVTVRVGARGIEIRRGPEGPAIEPVLIGGLPATDLGATLHHRSADSITIQLTDPEGRRVGSVTVVRGLPGAYIGIVAAGSRLTMGRVRRVAIGRALERSLGSGGGSSDTLAALMPMAAVTSAGPDLVALPLDGVLLEKRRQQLVLQFLGSDGVAFVGPVASSHLRVHASLPGGAYLSIPSARGAMTRVVRAATARPHLLRLMLDDAHRSGAAESLSLAFTYRAVSSR